MFRSLPIPGLFALPTEPVLLLCGLFASLVLAERLAAILDLPPQPVNRAAVLALGGMFAGERLLPLSRSPRSLFSHPVSALLWASTQGSPWFFAGIGIALATAAAYLLFRRVPLLRAAAALTPPALLLLAFAHAAYFAAGAEPGRRTFGRWGAVCTSRMAHALYGTPLDVPLFPVAAWLALGYAVFALAGAIAVAKGRSSTGSLLLAAGLLSVLAGQLALRMPGEPLVLGVFTWAQAAGTCAAATGALLVLRYL